MKRFYLILSLFMISFFFFSMNEVSASTFIITEAEMNYINDDFYALREETIKYCNENNKKYIISYNGVVFFANIFDEGNVYMNTVVYKDFNFPVLVYNSADVYRIMDGVFKKLSISPTVTNFHTNSYVFTMNPYIDSNVDQLVHLNYSHDLIYGDYTYHIDSGSHFPSLFEIYNIINAPKDPFETDKLMLGNFYLTIGDKIGDLAIIFARNYIFIVITGILILIFVFELIRRKLL